jgi:hypothetical protein
VLNSFGWTSAIAATVVVSGFTVTDYGRVSPVIPNATQPASAPDATTSSAVVNAILTEKHHAKKSWIELRAPVRDAGRERRSPKQAACVAQLSRNSAAYGFGSGA